MDAVRTVAKTAQPNNGSPERDAVRSTGLAWLTNAALVAAKPPAASVLRPKRRCLKNNLLQPPIARTFHAHRASAFVLAGLASARASRYPPTARPASMAVHATGNDASGGLKRGSRRDLYQRKMRGWFGDGALEALNIKGTSNAHDPMAMATGIVNGLEFSGRAVIG